MLDNNKTIKQSGQGNVAFQDSDVYITVSIYDEIEKLSEAGKYNEVADRIKYLMDFVGTKHPLYPHYRYKPIRFGNTTVLEHEPLSEEAAFKYPLSYRGNFSVSEKALEGYDDFNDLIEDAFYKQEKIEINMSSLTTWLGEHLVETPNLDKTIEEGKWVIVPQPLPEPLKLKFYIKGTQDISIVDYLEMSVSGKEGKEFIIADNKRQKNAKLLISLKLPILQTSENEYEKTGDAKINVKIKPEYQSNVEANLSLLRFFKLVENGDQSIAFKNLTEDKDFIVASSFKFDGDINDIDKDYEFVKRLNNIEKHFNLTFVIPEVLEKDDWEIIEILEHSMENKPLNKKLNNLTADLNDKEAIQKFVDLFENGEPVKNLMIEQSGTDAHIEFFGEIIPIEKVKTLYNSLRIDNLEKVKRKLELMDEGENIKITFLPGDDRNFTEEFYLKKS